jgi:hypothetical protein
MEEKQKRIRREDDKIILRWGDKEVGAPINVLRYIIIILVIIIFGAILLYSDWNIGPCSHNADDVPKPKAKTVIQ